MFESISLFLENLFTNNDRNIKRNSAREDKRI